MHVCWSSFYYDVHIYFFIHCVSKMDPNICSCNLYVYYLSLIIFAEMLL